MAEDQVVKQDDLVQEDDFKKKKASVKRKAEGFLRKNLRKNLRIKKILMVILLIQSKKRPEGEDIEKRNLLILLMRSRLNRQYLL